MKQDKRKLTSMWIVVVVHIFVAHWVTNESPPPGTNLQTRMEKMTTITVMMRTSMTVMGWRTQSSPV